MGSRSSIWHRERCGKSEQAHAVMKEDLAGGRLPSGSFGENAAWWQIMVLALNLNTLFKREALGEGWASKRLKALRYALIDIPGKVVSWSRGLIVRMSDARILAPVTGCVVCGSSALDEIRAAEISRIEEVSFSYSFSPENCKTFRVVRCAHCSHAFCSPLPSGIVGSYRDVVDDEYLKHSESRRLSADAVLGTVEGYAPGKRLLDVGCATGDFVEVARARGYSAEGLELSNWSCSIARGRGLTVHQESLAGFAAHETARFDVVSLIGVIEHFPDPRAEMANLAALVRPGGVVVIWTGDSAALLPRALGRRWWYWQGQHIQFFTHRSLSRLAEDAGFRHVGTTRYPFAATHATLKNSLRRYRLHRLMSAALVPLFALRPVVYLKLSGEMVFIAQRAG
jgi:2-polyprenyl-3-methyl-5-hydroxy-6-metoxy-1,4-benzoquinol methylase